MAKYILVYKINDYADNGGGTFIEYPKNEDDLTELVNSLNNKYKDLFEIECAGWLQIEIKFKPVEYAVRMEISKT